MAKRLRDVRIHEVSAVDRGAGEGCLIVLRKRASGETEGNSMTMAIRDEMRTAIRDAVNVLADGIRKSDRTLTIEGARAAAFERLPAPLRELQKALERGAPVAELQVLQSIAKAGAKPKVHLEQPDSDEDRRDLGDRGRADDDDNASPMDKLNRKAAKLVRKGKFPTHAQAFAHVVSTDSGRALLAADKAQRVGPGF